MSFLSSPSSPSGFQGFIEDYKPFVVLPVFFGVLYIVYLFFRSTWQELDREALHYRTKLSEEGKTDLRPLVALCLCALILAMQEYYGGHSTFYQIIKPKLEKLSPFIIAHTSRKKDPLGLMKYSDLWGYAWWAGTRIGGYVFPFFVWKRFFKEDSLLDMGLRTKGFLKHAWIYGLFLAAVLPAMLFVAHSPDFGTYYPFYKESSRSIFDYLLWECMYFAQFFALELFFRGFFLHSLRRSFGSGAIFAMALPYCMIHFGKPYLEAIGAIIAGIALGSISMKTKSIYQGFLVHVTVAGLMDFLALWNRHALPHSFWAP